MPRSPLSLRLSGTYRDRLAGITQRVQRAAEAGWPTITELDNTRWTRQTASTLSDAQKEAIRATSGYVTAYLTAELDRRVPLVRIDSSAYAGKSRDGRPLEEALQSPLIGVLAALKDGRPDGEALAIGRVRAVRMVEMDLMHAARAALTDAIRADDRFDGWERLTAGTCGACMALSGTRGAFHVHPGCKCVPQPVVKDVPNTIPVKTGLELFTALTRAEQDAQFGPEKAEALRKGEITLAALVATSHLDSDQPDFITEAPLEAAESATTARNGPP